jgi:hypothetical protein
VRVTVKQRGGFAGVDVDLAQVDTAALDADRRAALEQQVRAVLDTASRREPHVGADHMEYELTVDQDGRRTVTTWVEDGSEAAAPIRDLVARLTEVG